MQIMFDSDKTFLYSTCLVHVFYSIIPVDVNEHISRHTLPIVHQFEQGRITNRQHAQIGNVVLSNRFVYKWSLRQVGLYLEKNPY